jgi:hypothetical protein
VGLAFHLCLLAYARAARDANLPLFSIVDSPTEGIGHRGNDAALIKGIETIFAAYETRHEGEEPIQLIVASNYPTAVQRKQSTIRLSNDYLLVGGVQHPA